MFINHCAQLKCHFIPLIKTSSSLRLAPELMKPGCPRISLRKRKKTVEEQCVYQVVQTTSKCIWHHEQVDQLILWLKETEMLLFWSYEWVLALNLFFLFVNWLDLIHVILNIYSWFWRFSLWQVEWVFWYSEEEAVKAACWHLCRDFWNWLIQQGKVYNISYRCSQKQEKDE